MFCHENKKANSKTLCLLLLENKSEMYSHKMYNVQYQMRSYTHYCLYTLLVFELKKLLKLEINKNLFGDSTKFTKF